MSWTIEVNGSLNVTTPSPIPQEDCDPLLDSIPIKVIKTVAYSVLLIVSLVGNSLVIAVIWRNRNLRTIINFFILNMAMSDLLIPLVDIPREIKGIYLPRELWFADGVFGSLTCKLIPFAIVISVTVSVLTLEIIAIERFLCVVLPMNTHPIHSKKTCFVLIALTWLIGALYPSIFFYKYKITHKDTTPYCIQTWQPAFNNAEAAKIQYPIFLVCFTMIPFVLLTSLYSAIIISLLKAHIHLPSEARLRRAKKYRQVTYMLVTVVIVFLVSWAPFNLHRFLSAYVWNSQRPCHSRHLVFIAHFLTTTYPAINPLVYYIFNANYRRGFQELFYSLFRCSSYCRKSALPAAPEGNICCAVEPVSPKAPVLLPLHLH